MLLMMMINGHTIDIWKRRRRTCRGRITVFPSTMNAQCVKLGVTDPVRLSHLVWNSRNDARSRKSSARSNKSS